MVLQPSTSASNNCLPRLALPRRGFFMPSARGLLRSLAWTRESLAEPAGEHVSIGARTQPGTAQELCSWSENHGVARQFACLWNIMMTNMLACHGRESWEVAMNHRGIEFTVAKTATPGIWQWQFRIGDQIKTGKTETKIDLLAIRRVQLRIDRELKRSARPPESAA